VSFLIFRVKPYGLLKKDLSPTCIILLNVAKAKVVMSLSIFGVDKNCVLEIFGRFGNFTLIIKPGPDGV